MNRDFKRIIDTIYAVCDSLNNSYDLGELSMKELMRMDLLKFVLYLGAADEVIAQEEADFITEYLEWEMTIPQWCEFIKKQNLQTDSILDDIPLTLKIFVDADNKAYSYDNSIMNVCENYIFVFETLGELFIESDNNVDRREQIALGKYISMLRQYYDDNTKRTNSFDENNEKEKDKNIRIKLDDRTIVIPQALPETIKMMQELVKLRDDLIQRAEKERGKYNPEDIYASPTNYCSTLYDVVETYSERYGKSLQKKYNEYFFFSPETDYLDKYRVVCRSVENKIHNRYQSYNEMRHLGIQVAEEQAAKEIRGMQVGIITNSFTSALIYTGVSALTYASQARKAQAVYDKNIKAYSGERPAMYEMQMMNEEIFPLIYPVAEKTTAVFMKCVMEIIDKYQRIGYEKLDDKHKTHMLVNELNYVFGSTRALSNSIQKLQSIGTGKEEYKVLLDILEECPYCPETYVKIIQIGIFDKKVFEIAKILHIEKIILPELEKYVSKNNNKFKDVLPALEIIAVYKSQSVEQIIKQQYQGHIDGIKRNYREAQILCTDSRKLAKWIAENINSDMDKVVATSKETVRDKVDLWIKSKLQDGQFDELSTMGLITIEDIRMKDSTQTTLEEVKAEYAAKLISLIDDYIKEAGKRKNVYEEAYDKFNAEIKKRNDAISEKNEELKQQGMLAFSKKKEIKNEIEQLKKELEDLRKTEPVDLKNAYFNMYSK